MFRKNFFRLHIVFVVFLFCLSACAKKDYERIRTFENYKSSFDEINQLVIGFLDNGKEGVCGVVKNHEYEVTHLYFYEEIALNDSQLVAINNIDRLFATDFSMIYVSFDRISYGGLGNEMYVYTFDGEYPNYFYYEDGQDKFTTYLLSDNWFLLIRK